MSDSFGDITGQNHAARMPCRVAYTINNAQPVISTIIGDQPLFYMDFDCQYEDVDDMSFDAADMNILQGELETLKKEIDSIDNLSKSFTHNQVNKVEDFIAEMSEMTAVSKEAVLNIEDIMDSLRESRLATAYLACAEEHSIEIKHSAQIEASCYDRESGTILINPNKNLADQQLLLTQELRRHWQHRQGALIHPLMFHPDNAVLVNRAQVADLIVSTIRVAWELQLSGKKEAWERIENSPMADLGRAFAREAFLDFRTINNGQAAAAVFEAWFLSERCRFQDKKLINMMLSDYKGYVFALEESEQQITPTLIAALGEMPFGKNYLAEHAVTIMEDPIFTDIRDRSNANFLWFIKFERSFRETEHDLQSSTGHSADRIHGSAFPDQGEDHAFSSATSADVVTLYAAQPEETQENGDKSAKKAKRLAPKANGKRTNKGSDASNVVYLSRGSGE